MANLDTVRQFVLRLVGGYPSALSAGLPIFLTLVYLLDLAFGINEYIALHSDSLFKLDLNRLSFYPVGHLGFLHLFFNIIALTGPLTRFERSHGTVYTGVVLNLFAVFTAIPYCLVCFVIGSKSSVIGASGWFFSFLAYMAFEESKVHPTIQLSPTHTFPTIFSPFATLLLIAILLPGSSLIGHLLGLLIGYAYSFGYMNKLFPPTWIIEKIEEKAEKAIELIPTPFIYYREIDAKHVRGQTEYVSIFETSAAGEGVSGAVGTAGFQGQGQPLGV